MNPGTKFLQQQQQTQSNSQMSAMHKEFQRLFKCGAKYHLFNIELSAYMNRGCPIQQQATKMNAAVDELQQEATNYDRDAISKGEYATLVRAAREFRAAWQEFEPAYDREQPKNSGMDYGHVTQREWVNALDGLSEILIKQDDLQNEFATFRDRVRQEFGLTIDEERQQSLRKRDGASL